MPIDGFSAFDIKKHLPFFDQDAKKPLSEIGVKNPDPRFKFVFGIIRKEEAEDADALSKDLSVDYEKLILLYIKKTIHGKIKNDQDLKVFIKNHISDPQFDSKMLYLLAFSDKDPDKNPHELKNLLIPDPSDTGALIEEWVKWVNEYESTQSKIIDIPILEVMRRRCLKTEDSAGKFVPAFLDSKEKFFENMDLVKNLDLSLSPKNHLNEKEQRKYQSELISIVINIKQHLIEKKISCNEKELEYFLISRFSNPNLNPQARNHFGKNLPGALGPLALALLGETQIDFTDFKRLTDSNLPLLLHWIENPDWVSNEIKNQTDSKDSYLENKFFKVLASLPAAASHEDCKKILTLLLTIKSSPTSLDMLITVLQSSPQFLKNPTLTVELIQLGSTSFIPFLNYFTQKKIPLNQLDLIALSKISTVANASMLVSEFLDFYLLDSKSTSSAMRDWILNIFGDNRFKEFASSSPYELMKMMKVTFHLDPKKTKRWPVQKMKTLAQIFFENTSKVLQFQKDLSGITKNDWDQIEQLRPHWFWQSDSLIKKIIQSLLPHSKDFPGKEKHAMAFVSIVLKKNSKISDKEVQSMLERFLQNYKQNIEFYKNLNIDDNRSSVENSIAELISEAPEIWIDSDLIEQAKRKWSELSSVFLGRNPCLYEVVISMRLIKTHPTLPNGLLKRGFKLCVQFDSALSQIGTRTSTLKDSLLIALGNESVISVLESSVFASSNYYENYDTPLKKFFLLVLNQSESKDLKPENISVLQKNAKHWLETICQNDLSFARKIFDEHSSLLNDVRLLKLNSNTDQEMLKAFKAAPKLMKFIFNKLEKDSKAAIADLYEEYRAIEDIELCEFISEQMKLSTQDRKKFFKEGILKSLLPFKIHSITDLKKYREMIHKIRTNQFRPASAHPAPSTALNVQSLFSANLLRSLQNMNLFQPTPGDGTAQVNPNVIGQITAMINGDGNSASGATFIWGQSTLEKETLIQVADAYTMQLIESMESKSDAEIFEAIPELETLAGNSKPAQIILDQLKKKIKYNEILKKINELVSIQKVNSEIELKEYAATLKELKEKKFYKLEVLNSLAKMIFFKISPGLKQTQIHRDFTQYWNIHEIASKESNANKLAHNVLSGNWSYLGQKAQDKMLEFVPDASVGILAVAEEPKLTAISYEHLQLTENGKKVGDLVLSKQGSSAKVKFLSKKNPVESNNLIKDHQLNHKAASYFSFSFSDGATLASTVVLNGGGADRLIVTNKFNAMVFAYPDGSIKILQGDNLFLKPFQWSGAETDSLQKKIDEMAQPFKDLYSKRLKELLSGQQMIPAKAEDNWILSQILQSKKLSLMMNYFMIKDGKAQKFETGGQDVAKRRVLIQMEDGRFGMLDLGSNMSIDKAITYLQKLTVSGKKILNAVYCDTGAYNFAAIIKDPSPNAGSVLNLGYPNPDQGQGPSNLIIFEE